MSSEETFSLLRKIGLTEYEAKIYMGVTRLRTATPAEVKEISGIPRGKVYETLSVLTEKGFLDKITDNRRVRYSLANTDILFRRLKNENLDMIDKLNDSLQQFADDIPGTKIVEVFEIKNFWAIQKQARMTMVRANSEIVILSDDDYFFENYAKDIIEASKRLSLYLVVPNNRTKIPVPVTCYHGGKDIEEVFFNPKNSPVADRKILTTIYCDRKESLFVYSKDEKTIALIISKGNQVQYICRKVLSEIKPMTDSDNNENV